MLLPQPTALRAQLPVCFVPWRQDQQHARVEALPVSGRQRLVVPLPLPFRLAPKVYAEVEEDVSGRVSEAEQPFVRWRGWAA